MGFLIGKHLQTEKGVRKFLAAPFEVTKFGRLVQSHARPEFQFTNCRVGPERLRTEALAALRAAPSQCPTAALGRHAGAKAVSAGAVQIAGIEGTFHSETRTKTT